MLSRRVLSKEEESETTDAEVTKSDQDQINLFSRLHNRSKVLDEELSQKTKDKEDLSDLSLELELVDDDEKIQYKIGDSFFSLSAADARETLTKDLEEIEKEVETLEDERDKIREETGGLKAKLYARFGRGINLES